MLRRKTKSKEREVVVLSMLAGGPVKHREKKTKRKEREVVQLSVLAVGHQPNTEKKD